ncbi:dTDP-4-dehydrorhamnose reductase [Gammaproteobacteria bacterium]|nr:dTDP-4-dehydrorhamnose reductase [Gammaproteobacteria bacterium]
MKVLVLGCKGQLGHCLYDQLIKTDYEVVFLSRVDFDIGDLSSLSKNVSLIKPDLVINASAYTAVDKAEDDKQMADLINHGAVAKLANVCKALNAWLIHVSTDYVFDGTATKPYSEDDKTNPQGIYGDSKLNGELAITRSGCNHIIIRTAWVFSEYGNNFMKTMLKLGAEKNKLSVVGDQKGCPTYAQDIAKVIVCMLARLGDKDIIGTYHFSGDRECSWFDFALEIFEQARNYGLCTPKVIESITTSEYPTPAKRPCYSVLDNNKIHKAFGVVPSDWRLGITSVLTSLQSD